MGDGADSWSGSAPLSGFALLYRKSYAGHANKYALDMVEGASLQEFGAPDRKRDPVGN
jgi:hypothetical protein